MAFMPWNEELALGISFIDEQHRGLVDRINALHDELARAAPDAKALGDSLDELVDAAMNHFIAEENVLKRHGHPQADAHAAAHSDHTAALVQLLDRLQGGTAATPTDLAPLKDWLTRHIQGEDQACAAFLKAKGVA